MHLDIVDPQPDAVTAEALGLRPRVHLAAVGAVYLLHHQPHCTASGIRPYEPLLTRTLGLDLPCFGQRGTSKL